MSEPREIKVIKKADRPPPRTERTEVSLLEILIERNPERAKDFLRRLGQSVKEVGVRECEN